MLIIKGRFETNYPRGILLIKLVFANPQFIVVLLCKKLKDEN